MGTVSEGKKGGKRGGKVSDIGSAGLAKTKIKGSGIVLMTA
jgi:hypothetical protein